jgi:hypothetical protein
MSCSDGGPHGKPLLNFLILSVATFWRRAKVPPNAALECYVQDLMVGSTKEVFDFAQFSLLSRGAVLWQFWTRHGLRCLGGKLNK